MPEEQPIYERMVKIVKEIEEGSRAISPEDMDEFKQLLDWLDEETIRLHATELERLRKITLDKSGIPGFNRRSEIEVIASILDIARESIRKTNIMREAKLSYTQLQKYLAFLTQINFLAMEGRAYRLTNRGETFLFHWSRMIDLIEGGGKRDGLIKASSST